MSAISGPNGSSGPMGPFQQFSDHVQKFIDNVPGLERGDIEGIFDEIRELPPDERFTESAPIFLERFSEQVDETEEAPDLEGNVEVIKSSLPVVLAQLEDKLDEARNETLKIVVQNREEAQAALIVAIYFDTLTDTIDAFRQMSLSGDVNETALSILFALNSRFVDFQSDDNEPAPEDLAKDILYANYYLAEEEGEVTPTHPSELSENRMIQQVLATGALRAYQELEISLSRGAELANMSLGEFEATLTQNGIQPRQGPDSDEVLYDEGEDWF